MTEMPLPEPPPVPRPVRWRSCLAFSWVFLLLGGVFLCHGLLLASLAVLVMGAGPPDLLLGLGVGTGLAGAVLAAVGLLRVQRRRRLLTTGRAVRGEVTGIGNPKGINPPPLSLRFEGEDPMSLQRVAGSRWFRRGRFPGPLPEPGAPCWIVFDEGGSGAPELLAVGAFRAWD
ncbi:MAG: hypothetical protein R3F30_07830 [Planctomycetota bacterium]